MGNVERGKRASQKRSSRCCSGEKSRAYEGLRYECEKGCRTEQLGILHTRLVPMASKTRRAGRVRKISTTLASKVESRFRA